MAAKWARKTVMLVGSSMTQRAYELQWGGFGIGLTNWWTRCADVLVRGQSGFNSRWTRMTLPEMIGPFRPDLVVLFLGNNDSITAGTGQHVPIPEFKENMLAILDTFRAVNPATAFLLLSPTRATKLGRIDEVTALYNEVIVDIGRNLENAVVVDLWTENGAFTVDAATDLHDGLHLNQLGNQKARSLRSYPTRRCVPHPHHPCTRAGVPGHPARRPHPRPAIRAVAQRARVRQAPLGRGRGRGRHRRAVGQREHRAVLPLPSVEHARWMARG